ncbi:hypothetical protein SAMN02746066_04066 [Anaerosporobacter mobilis DSM 15930]|uniref:Uncharacterized protein n=1 Tax=Anaerosporobacter mobilis DSM 15930 TaxID=1120996 RepID=A0A1M7MWF6_9FIRM|nr:hypothetical protein [Anaerosporobacter mobilis]SHM95371.1 hypothetical protein SAMN02746066_04066 [Anaerosporobacter mobilis DSM 15930]
MNTFNNLKTIATLKRKSPEEIMNLADIFLMNERITAEQYQELVKLLESK